MIILVTGGREFGHTRQEQWCIYETLYDTLLESQPPGDREYLSPKMHLIISGEARGTDKVAKYFAELHFIPYKGYKPIKEDFDLWGRGGPLRRNQRMLDYHPDIDLVVAFPGGTGTADMIKRAKEAHKKVKEVTYDEVRRLF